ncbi:putative membrane protein, partial [Rhodopirellula sallentina]
MLEQTLRNRLFQVAVRFRQRQWWWCNVAIALVIAFIAAVMLPSVQSGTLDPLQTVCGLLVGAALLSAVAYFVAVRNYRDDAQIARRVEGKFPGLQQRLVTAVSLCKAPEACTGYLQQRVIREACDHGQRHAWSETVSRRQVILSRLSGVGALAVMCLVLGMMLLHRHPSQSLLANSAAPLLGEVAVSPGDVEVERGTNLLVTATFGEEYPNVIPSEGELRIVTESGEESRVPMQRNLLDPVLGGLIRSVQEPFQYQVLTNQWSSATYAVDVFEFPELVRSDVSIQYPSYTQFSDKVIEDTRRVSAVEGSRIAWTFSLNKPVVSARLMSDQGEVVELRLKDEGRIAVSEEVVLVSSNKFALELEDDRGRRNKYPPELVVRALSNRAPTLKTTAAGDVRVSPLEELRIAAESEDDFGIKRIGVTYSFNGERNELVLDQNIRRAAQSKVEHLIEFESLEAKPDQLLSYFFWVEDVGPDERVRRTQGDMYFAEVRPFEEIFREGDPPPGGQPSPPSETEQQAEQLSESQKEIIGATWRVIRNGVNDNFQVDVETIAEAQQGQIDSLDELSENLQDEESLQYVRDARDAMTTAFDRLGQAASDRDLSALEEALTAEQAAYEGLLKLRAREFEVTRSQQSQSSSSSIASRQRQQQLDDLELKQDENRYETQNQAQQEDASEQQDRETRQVLSRLRELAKRQEDINEQVAKLQSALEMAEDEPTKQEIERQLKRLRDQQQEMLREIDELDQRMQDPSNQSSMQEESEQLAQTRENVREAAEALQQNDASKALSAGKRAERELESMRDEMRKRAAGQFNDAVREMRSAATELDERQQDLSERLKDQQENAGPGLRAGAEQERLEQELQEQRVRLNDLQERMQDTVEQAETAEPLLAESLYESFLETQRDEVDDRLQEAEQLLQNGFAEEAVEAEAVAGEGIRNLREGLEEAASSILGDETEALRRAADALDQLSRDVEEEMRAAGGVASEQNEQDAQREGARGSRGESDSNEPSRGDSQSQQGRRPGDQPSGNQAEGDQPGEGQPGENPSEGNQSGENQPSGNGQSEGRQPDGDQQGQQSGSPGSPATPGSPGSSAETGAGSPGDGAQTQQDGNAAGGE